MTGDINEQILLFFCGNTYCRVFNVYNDFLL